MRRECVRTETVSFAEGAARSQIMYAKKGRAVGKSTLSAPTQIDQTKIESLDASKPAWKRIPHMLALIVPLAFLATLPVFAQSVGTTSQSVVATAEAPPMASSLPLPPPAEIDAPLPQPSTSAPATDPAPALAAVPQDQPGGYQVAPLHTKFILPNQRAQNLAPHDKMLIALEDVYSPLNFGGIIAAAGYEQLRNGQPNYGTDRGAFGERLGAAGIRDTAQGVFTDGVYAPLLHEDPRYYVEGSQFSLLHRALYAVTRPVITRSDSGHATINGALLLGYVSATALNNAYYPSVNRNVRDNAEAFAGSLGGSALGFFLTEFTSSLWGDLHFGHKQ